MALWFLQAFLVLLALHAIVNFQDTNCNLKKFRRALGWIDSIGLFRPWAWNVYTGVVKARLHSGPAMWKDARITTGYAPNLTPMELMPRDLLSKTIVSS